MMDPSETERRKMMGDINAKPMTREELEAKYGQVWDSDQLRDDFTVKAFLAPFCVAIQKSTGVKGSIMFQHHPRFYFKFDEQR